MQERMMRHERESRYLRKDSDQRKVMEEVFDRATLLVVEELVRRGQIADLYGVVAAGKESRVYYGVSPKGQPVAVKIYLTASAEFKKRLGYIAGDKRFGRLPANSRETINLWVRKEFRNLQSADAARVRVPKPYAFYKNIIVMEYIGEPPRSAPLFAEAEVDESDYGWTFDCIARLYRSAGLVHADLSEFNIFKTEKERVLFDMGTAVLTSHPQASEYLRRDISNMVRFFRKRGLFEKDTEAWLREMVE
ncbi:MAG: serine protein kinase RIO [Nitrososphaerales archaeon]|nr:serine protein kinase RIO [Nitrososphaerales archaeon]